MNKQSTTYLILIILVATIAINYWPNSQIDSQTGQAPSTADYFFKQVSVKQFDQSGKLENQLNAEKLEHFKHNQLSEIVAPQITVSNPQNSNWQISAATGQLNHISNLVKLSDSVVIEQSSHLIDETSSSNATIKTQRLSFNLNNNTASTDDNIEITTSDTHTTAKAMLADFKNSLIKLKGHTKTEGIINDVE